MKKFALIAYILLSGTVLIAQVDSTQALELIQIGFAANQAFAPHDYIKGVPNNAVEIVSTAIIMAIIGLIHKRRTVKKWRKSGRLRD